MLKVLRKCSIPDSGRAAYTKAHNENLGQIPLLSDDWFSHETLSHNGICPMFSLCAFEFYYYTFF